MLSSHHTHKHQIKFLFPRVGEKSLQIKRISVIVEDMAKKRDISLNKPEPTKDRKGVLDRPNSTAIQHYVPPPPPPPQQPFNTESAVMVGLVVVDQVLGVMTKEIQENLESTCRGVEDRLLQDLSVLEEKMRRIEDAYDDIAADVRLSSLQSSLAQARAARGLEPTYDGDQPILAEEHEEEQEMESFASAPSSSSVDVMNV